MRWLRALLIPAAMFLLVSCSSDDEGDATAAATSEGSAATAAATSEGGGSGSGGGGSSASSDDVNQWIEDLTPPNASEVARFSAPEGTTVSFQSSDSFDDLKSYYDDKIADLGIQVVGTLTVEGSNSWIIGDDSDNGIGGTISIAPDGDNTIVTIILGIGG